MPLFRFRCRSLAALSHLVLVSVTALLLNGCGGGGSHPSDTTTVNVDFAQPVAAKSMVGFLHSLSSDDPINSLVSPLQPRLWRSGAATPVIYPRAKTFGATYVLVCSDYWGYDPQNRPDQNSNIENYRTQMQKLAQQHQGDGIVYDIWNEPNTVQYWSGTQLSYFQTFKVAHDAIRSVQPNALISGPSNSLYDHGTIEYFLKFCLAQNIKLDVLSWHEFGSGNQIPDIQSHLQEARRDFLDNPEYAALGIKQIQINETIGSDIQYKAASSLAVLDGLERGGADAAAHACWNDPEEGSNCALYNLDGLLRAYYSQPRSVWWAFKAYADGVASRVLSTSTNSRFVSLASSKVVGVASTAPAPQIIVGMYTVPSTSSNGTATLVLNHLSAVPGIAGAASLRLTIKTIPATGNDPLPTLPPATTMSVPVLNDSATVTLPVNLEEAAVVSLAPA